MFEEQFVAPTLEDAIVPCWHLCARFSYSNGSKLQAAKATAGRVDIRAFDEEARYFSFGPVSLQGAGSGPSS